MRALSGGTLLSDGSTRSLASQLLGWAVLSGFGQAESVPWGPARSGTVGLFEVERSLVAVRCRRARPVGRIKEVNSGWDSAGAGFAQSDLVCRTSSIYLSATAQGTAAGCE